MVYIKCPKCKNKTNDFLTYCNCGYQLNKLKDKSEYIEEDIEINNNNNNNNLSHAAYCFRGIGMSLIFLVIINLLTMFLVFNFDVADVDNMGDLKDKTELMTTLYIFDAIISLIILGFIISYFFDASKSISKIKIN